MVQDKRYENSSYATAVVPPASRPNGSAELADCALLAAATLLPVVVCIRRLGFYADDWGNLGRFVGNGDTTVAACFRRLNALPGTHGRPAMNLYLAVLFRLFGERHLGYDIANAAVLFVAAALFYFSLRLVLRQRFVALSVPLIFVLLPNYSSDRVVPCTFMTGLSLALFFLNMYALLKAESKTTLSAGWTGLSVVAMLVSGLLYEILLPLFVLNIWVVWGLQLRKPSAERLRIRALALLSFVNAAALFALLVYKKITATRPHELASLKSVALQALVVHFYKLGLRLPVVAAKAAVFYFNPTLDLLALLLGILVFRYFLHLQRPTRDEGISSNLGLRLIFFGAFGFAVALAIFVASGGATGFTATGFENRTAIGCSLGVAFVFSGLSIWLGGMLTVHRAFFVSLLIGLLCSGELLASGTVSSFWAAAAEQQQLILQAIKHDIPTLPHNSALILDGVCPYMGPGIIFEGHQDMGGALQVLYRDPSLRGDVVSRRLLVHEDGIETSIYGRPRYYSYGSVRLYDFRSRKVTDLRDRNAALDYFGRLGPPHSFCPEAIEGEEVPIF